MTHNLTWSHWTVDSHAQLKQRILNIQGLTFIYFFTYPVNQRYHVCIRIFCVFNRRPYTTTLYDKVGTPITIFTLLSACVYVIMFT